MPELSFRKTSTITQACNIPSQEVIFSDVFLMLCQIGGDVRCVSETAGKRGRPKTKDGKIDMKNLDLTRMEKMEMKDIEGTAYTLIAYSKALRCKV